MAEEGSAYYKIVQRISKKDLFVCLALWMEESPLVSTIEDSEIFDDSTGIVNSKLGDKRKNVELGANQDIKKVKVLVNDEVNSDCNKHEEIDNQFFMEKVDSEHTLNDNVIINPMRNSNEAGKVRKLDTEYKLNSMGVVVVDSNERIVAIDYSHQDLHAVTNAMVVHSEKMQGCVVYASRKPCSFCTKFMIQMGITKVYYLPLEPECPTTEDLNHCEQMYRTCPIAQSVYVPSVCQSVIRDSSVKRSPYTPTKQDHVGLTQVLLSKYWNKEWVDILPQVLFWPDFEKISGKVDSQMTVMFEWLAKVTLVDVPETTIFKPYGLPNGLVSERMDIDTPNNDANKILKKSATSIASDSQWQQIALHMSRMAQILAQRSDDPTRGVGAVVLKEEEIVAVGWNGFPSKALYGDFPRANDRDDDTKDKKYPYIIHAEQSTVLSRLVQDLNHESTTMFVNKMPCNECMPIILKVGIRNVVFPPERTKQYTTYLKTDLITSCIVAGKLNGFVSGICPKNEGQAKVVSRNLNFHEAKKEKETLKFQD